MATHSDKMSALAANLEHAAWLLEFTAHIKYPFGELRPVFHVGPFLCEKSARKWFNLLRVVLQGKYIIHTSWKVEKGKPVAVRTRYAVAKIMDDGRIRPVDGSRFKDKSGVPTTECFRVVPLTDVAEFATHIRAIALEKLSVYSS